MEMVQCVLLCIKDGSKQKNFRINVIYYVFFVEIRVKKWCKCGLTFSQTEKNVYFGEEKIEQNLVCILNVGFNYYFFAFYPIKLLKGPLYSF